MTDDEINVEKIRIQKSKKLFNFSVRHHLSSMLYSDWNICLTIFVQNTMKHQENHRRIAFLDNKHNISKFITEKCLQWQQYNSKCTTHPGSQNSWTVSLSSSCPDSCHLAAPLGRQIQARSTTLAHSTSATAAMWMDTRRQVMRSGENQRRARAGQQDCYQSVMQGRTKAAFSTVTMLAVRSWWSGDTSAWMAARTSMC